MTLRFSNRPSTPLVSRVGEKIIFAIGSLALFDGESLSNGHSTFTQYTPSRERLSSLGLDKRDLAILSTVADCRLITTLQLQRLHFIGHSTPLSGARACRRTLKRLSEQRVLSRRKRRIGGVRRGSSSFVYSLGSIGIKLLSNNNKHRHQYITDPSDYFFEHTLEIAELYTRLYELAADGKLHLLEVQTEPNCWRQFPNTLSGKLYPDMFVRAAKEDEEYRYFIELDRDTTHLPSIIKKLQQYQQYYASGVEQKKYGLFPQVLWIVPDNRRKSAIKMAVQTSQKYPDGLFVVETVQHAISYIREPRETNTTVDYNAIRSMSLN